MKTYEWMAAERGSAHFCERDGNAAPKPVCKAEPKGALTACGQDKTRCVHCTRMEPDIRRYQELMQAKTP